MKTKTTVFLISMLCIVELYAQTTHVPDNNFEQALIDQGYDDALDDYVLTSKISGLTYLDVSNKNIADLQGIQDFARLNTLVCKGNQLNSINLGQNTALGTLNCESNQLSSLDVSQNTAMLSIRCSYNKLTSLDITQNIFLDVLYCEYNQLTSLDVSQNTSLKVFLIRGNQLTGIDLSKNTVLERFYCDVNKLTSLNVSLNKALTHLYCSQNQLSSLDLNQNTALQYLECGNNDLTSLDVSQNTALTNLYLQRNEQLTFLNANNENNSILHTVAANYNPSLTCIQVDNEAIAKARLLPYSNWSKDATASYSENCSLLGLTYAPDNNFEQALIDFGYDDELDDYVTTSNISGLTTLDVSARNIVDLTGIGDFISLTDLYCQNNQLINLDVRQNKVLETLNCSSNELIKLDVQNGNNDIISAFNAINNPNLTCIQVDNEIEAISGLAPYDTWLKDLTASYSDNCYNPGYTYIPDKNFEQALINQGYDDVLDAYILTSNISGLTYLDVSNKNITDLQGIRDFASLTQLNCKSNKLASIDISQNTALVYLNCDYNQLISLDLTQNTALYQFIGSFNQLTSLDVSQNPALELLSCEYNQLASMDVSLNSALKQAYIRGNQLTGIDLSKNTVLERFYCDANKLTSLDVSLNTALTHLYCSQNQLSSLDLSQNTALEYLECGNNDLTSLDVSQNTALTNLYLQRNNQLTFLNAQNGNNSILLTVAANYNPSLTCIQVDNVANAQARLLPYSKWSKDASASYSEQCQPNFVSGFVTNEAGEPLGGIQVIVKSVSDTGPFTAATAYVSIGTTLSDGTYEVNDLALPGGSYDDVKVYFYDPLAMYVAEGYDDIMFTDLTEQEVWDGSIPVARGSTTVNAALTKNAVSGLVTDEAGAPLEGIQLIVRSVSDTGPFTAGNMVSSVGVTQLDGSYEVSLADMGFAFAYEDVKVYFYDPLAMYVAEGYDDIMFTDLTEQEVWDGSIPVARDQQP